MPQIVQPNYRQASLWGDSGEHHPERVGIPQQPAALEYQRVAVRPLTGSHEALSLLLYRRATRSFTDLTVTRDMLRVVVHLDRKVGAGPFVKAGRSGRVSLVAFVRTLAELRQIVPCVREAYELAAGEWLGRDADRRANVPAREAI